MSDPSELQARVLELEELLAHQEHVVRELNDTVVLLRNRLDRLESVYQSQQRRLEWLAESGSGSDAPADEKPPHY